MFCVRHASTVEAGVVTQTIVRGTLHMRNHRFRPAIEKLEGRCLFSASYFVDNTAAPDGDGSALLPWDSIADVNGASFSAGDVVQFQGGQTYDGSLFFGADDTGSPTAPILITSYGTGRAMISAGLDHGLVARNTAGLTISNLNFLGTGQGANTSSGIWFDNTLGGASKLPHVFIDSVDVSGFGKYGITIGGSGSSGKAGFGIPDADPANPVNGVRITNAAVHDNILGGIETHGVFSSTAIDYANDNVYVGHCNVYNNTGYAGSPTHSGDGIVLSDADGLLIERNVAFNNGAKNTHVGGPVGIWVWDVNGAVIQYNESHHNKTASTADGGGFDLDGGVTNSVIQYNYSHDNDGAGYGIYQFQGARPFFKNTVRYNVSENDARKNGYGAIDFWNGNGSNGIRDIDVYNNTVYVTPSGPLSSNTDKNSKAIRFISGTTDVRIRNNIFQTTGGLWIADVQAKHTGLLFQGNDYYSSGSAFKLKWFAKVYGDFASFRKGSAQETVAGKATGSDKDPQLGSISATGPRPGSGLTVTIDQIDQLGALVSAAYRPRASLNTGGTTPFSNGGSINLWHDATFALNPGRKDFSGADVLPVDATSAKTFRFDVGALQMA
jgi:hypothetical protein